MTRPASFGLRDLNQKPDAPLVSWWADPITGSFYMKCQEEWKRMRHSREAQRMGIPMVIAQVDGKQSRTS